MSDKIDSDWIDLRGALIWVLTRDSNALEETFRRSSSLSLTRPPNYWKRGWQNLRPAIAKAKVRARGQPFDQAPPTRITARVITFPLPRESLAIEFDWVTTLELDTNLFDLKPTGWALVGGRGWTYVEIARTDLALAFPEGAGALMAIQRASIGASRTVTRSALKRKLTKVSPPPKEILAEMKPEPKPEPEHPIIETWRSIYPDSPPRGTKIKKQDDKIIERLKTETGSSPDYSTIRRVFKKAGIKRQR